MVGSRKTRTDMLDNTDMIEKHIGIDWIENSDNCTDLNLEKRNTTKTNINSKNTKNTNHSMRENHITTNQMITEPKSYQTMKTSTSLNSDVFRFGPDVWLRFPFRVNCIVFFMCKSY